MVNGTLYLGLLVEPIADTLARLSLLRHATFASPIASKLVHDIADQYAAERSNYQAEGYVITTLLNVGSRRMGSCMRGEPWCDEMSGSRDVKAQWAAFRAQA